MKLITKSRNKNVSTENNTKKMNRKSKKADSSSATKSAATKPAATKPAATKPAASKTSASKPSRAVKAPVANTTKAKKALEAKSSAAKSLAAKTSVQKSSAVNPSLSKTEDKTPSSKIESKSTKNIPKKIEAHSLSDYLEIMSIAVFQASVSWALILNKLDNFRNAFDKFDPSRVSNYDEEKIESLMQDAGILRNEKKIRATITNAKTMLSLAEEHGSFPNYLHSFKSYELLAKDMKKRFKFFGDLSVYYFLFRIGEPVPDFNKWIETIPGEHPRMREMVEQYET